MPLCTSCKRARELCDVCVHVGYRGGAARRLGRRASSSKKGHKKVGAQVKQLRCRTKFDLRAQDAWVSTDMCRAYAWEVAVARRAGARGRAHLCCAVLGRAGPPRTANRTGLRAPGRGTGQSWKNGDLKWPWVTRPNDKKVGMDDKGKIREGAEPKRSWLHLNADPSDRSLPPWNPLEKELCSRQGAR